MAAQTKDGALVFLTTLTVAEQYVGWGGLDAAEESVGPRVYGEAATGTPAEAFPNGSGKFQQDGLYLRTGGAWTLLDPDVAVQRATVTIPAGNGAGNVGDLNTTPVTVIAAQGPDTIIEVVSVHFFLDFAAAAYDTAATTQLRYTNGAGAAVLGTAVPSASLMTAAADAHVLTPAVAENVVPVANAPIVVHTSADPFGAAGDSPVIVDIFYRVRDFTP